MHSIFLSIDWDYVRDWLGIVRWLHVIAAIMWVGITAYFVLVDNVLLPPDREGEEDGVEGERYWLHGGGFYYMRRYSWGPRELPRNVQWHPQWYAYTTWLSGFALLIVAFYWKADTYLVDPTVWRISGGIAVGISIAVLAAGWAVYDGLCRLLVGHGRILAILLVLIVAGTAAGLSHVFSARGMAIQVGALLGTWMAGNVVFVFSPAHREQWAAKKAGRAIDPAWVARSAQRGMHNTYMAMPVLFAMLGGHFTFVDGSGRAWEALIALMLFGVAIRYFFVQRQKGRILWQIPLVGVAGLVALAFWLAPSQQAAPASGAASAAGGPRQAAKPDARTLAAGRAVFETAGCTGCHTLAEAGATGSVGPNLDQAKPPSTLVVQRVTNGDGVMPSFNGRMSPQQIAAVAAYVSTVAGQ